MHIFDTVIIINQKIYVMISKLNDGGPLFTYPMVLFLILIIAIFVKELIKKDDNEKTLALLSSFGWFSVAWAFLGHTIGLITAFDSIGAAGELAPKYMAEGLKIALLNLLFGAFLLLITRLCMIILIIKGKKP